MLQGQPRQYTHTIKKYHIDSAGSTVSKGIVTAPEKYRCYYLEYVGDGDSTFADRVLMNTPIVILPSNKLAILGLYFAL